MSSQDSAQATEADSELERRVRIYLFSHKMPNLRGIAVTAQGDRVTLRGRVHRYYERQLCISSCLRVAGVRIVDDQIVVDPVAALAGCFESAIGAMAAVPEHSHS